MGKYTTDERTGMKYELFGDYYLIARDDEPDEEQRPINIWRRWHLRYLKKHRKVFYVNLLTSSKLNNYGQFSSPVRAIFPCGQKSMKISAQKRANKTL